MTTRYYGAMDGDIVRFCSKREEVEEGPPAPAAGNPFGYASVLLDGPVDWSARPSPLHSLRRAADGSLTWESAPLDECKAQVVADIDIFADSCRLAVVGDAARIKEYERAQAGAEAYRDAGFAGPVPPGVASWAHAKRRSNWTAQQAAEDILAASARWYAALDGIRALRLDAKEGARFAVTVEEVAATAATFRATLTAAMEGVQ